MSWVAVGVVAGGALLSAGGQYMSTKAQKDAAADNKKFDEKTAYSAMARQALQLYGADKGEQWIRANLPREWQDKLFGTPDFQQELTVQPGDPRQTTAGGQGILGVTNRQNQLVSEKQYRTVKGIKGELSLDSMKSLAGDGLLAKLERLSADQIGQQRGVQTAADNLAIDSVGYGNARRAEIQRDADRMLAQTNKLTGMQSRASGLGGSSIQANQNAGNAARLFESRNNTLTGLDMGVQDRTMNLQRQALALRMSGMDRENSLRMQPINAEQSALSGSLFNPFSGGNNGQYFSSASPWGNVLQGFGSSAGTVGGMLLLKNLMGQSNVGQSNVGQSNVG